MKLSSPPTRWALTSVIAAAMKYGPTKVPRIAYELDMPVETCRYYLKKFYEAGFRLQPVVDYWALGLAPTLIFIRFDRRVPAAKKQTLLSWLDTVYVVYRAPLENDREQIILMVPPKGDEKALQEILAMLKEADLLEDFFLAQITDGYYLPEWVTMYDFINSRWSSKVDVRVPQISVSNGFDEKQFDETDLTLIEEIEVEPKVKMKKISAKHGVSPQLLSYHREKHVEGTRLITGYVPLRRTAYQDVNIVFITQLEESIKDSELKNYHFSTWKLKRRNLIRFHIPADADFAYPAPVLNVTALGVRWFTVPREHFIDGKWVALESFVERVTSLIKIVA
ncbi:MAG: hypothetical protein NZ581_03105 [Candidatus Caldarchaeum sp.]|nr:hypothetical protein [Candidatus Caldarchaeum sp.]MDW8435173.1 hypothetical protein [Candidatus Caldarchaeum sp.]